jgi:hypothetical protein
MITDIWWYLTKCCNKATIIIGSSRTLLWTVILVGLFTNGGQSGASELP